MHIILCTDTHFIMPVGVLMCSVCVNNADADIVFHVVIDESVSETDKQDLSDVCSSFSGKTIEYHLINSNDFAHLPALGSTTMVTQATYYRLLLPELLPDDLGKVLFLDGDMIVRGSLVELWNTALEGYAFAAVPDPLDGTQEQYDRLGYPESCNYFNAGMMLVNLDYWRSHQSTDRFFEVMRSKCDVIRYFDQDVLNFTFQGKVLPLHMKYNFMAVFLRKHSDRDERKKSAELQEAIDNPVIIHYAGLKPWQYNRYNHPYSSSWKKYQSQTKWRAQPIKDTRSWYLRVVNFGADLLRSVGLKKSKNPYMELLPVD